MIVMKFGGTSVGDAVAIRRLMHAVTHSAAEHPLTVVSAMSGTTDALLALDALAATGDRAGIQSAMDRLAARHLDAAEALGVGEPVRHELRHVLGTLREELLAHAGVESTLERRDRIVGAGELLSSRLVVGALIAGGWPARWFDAREVLRTDTRFGAAHPATDEIARLVRERLAPLLDGRELVVTQGFIGCTDDGRATTLGRGGSDFSAALLGAALPASRVEIWTDVDGLMTADPRVVPTARLLPEASYDEAAELASFGAKVLHPATQLPLVDANIPIVIRNTFAPDAAGTTIAAHAGDAWGSPIRSISFKKGVTVVQIRAPRMLGAFGFLRRIFEVFERHEVVVDVLATSEVSVSLTIDDASRLDAVRADLALIGEVATRPARGVVAVVGRGIREVPGIAARVYAAIPGVNVEMISQGASASNLTFVVKEQDGPTVVRALHDTFFPEAA